MSQYLQALQIDTKFAVAYAGRGMLHFKAERWREAVQDFEKFLKYSGTIGKMFVAPSHDEKSVRAALSNAKAMLAGGDR